MPHICYGIWHMKRKLTLIVLDGWGISPIEENNPIFLAKTPTLDTLMREYPYGVLDAAGLSVGLPWGQVGNSEVGHLTLGAGTVLYQNQPRINLAIESGEFAEKPALKRAAEHAKQHNSRIHIHGLISTGGVHGHMDHIIATLEALGKLGVKDAYIHGITDGRDSPPQGGRAFVKELEARMKKIRLGKIASLCGRFYAMDRNHGWDRTQRAYDLMTKSVGTAFKTADQVLEASYKKNIDDEALEPAVIMERSVPMAVIGEHDALIYTHYREDRVRQIAQAFAQTKFKAWDRGEIIGDLLNVYMIEYEPTLPGEIVFPPQHIKKPFGSLIADHGWSQLRIAETEKYAHVTYFFNGGNEVQFPREERILISSPKVRTYDQAPAMSAQSITDTLIKRFESNTPDFTLVNFANADMVGHTGDLKATIQGVETIDHCVKQLLDATSDHDMITLITADHGNAEIVVDPLTGKIDKEHSTNPVPFIVVDPKRKREKSEQELTMLKYAVNPIGILADVAPTMCELLEIDMSPEMTGRSLLADLT